jgi:hypothetical protein
MGARRLEEAGADIHGDYAADPRLARGCPDDQAAPEGESQHGDVGQEIQPQSVDDPYHRFAFQKSIVRKFSHNFA